jgi:hypothetical protein
LENYGKLIPITERIQTGAVEFPTSASGLSAFAYNDAALPTGKLEKFCLLRCMMRK